MHHRSPWILGWFPPGRLSIIQQKTRHQAHIVALEWFVEIGHLRPPRLHPGNGLTVVTDTPAQAMPSYLIENPMGIAGAFIY
jgi:hypothetical protein